MSAAVLMQGRDEQRAQQAMVELEQSNSALAQRVHRDAAKIKTLSTMISTITQSLATIVDDEQSNARPHPGHRALDYCTGTQSRGGQRAPRAAPERADRLQQLQASHSAMSSR